MADRKRRLPDNLEKLFADPGLVAAIRRFKTGPRSELAGPTAKWAQYQQFLDEAHRRYPKAHYSALTSMTARHFGVSQKTIRRRTQKPR